METIKLITLTRGGRTPPIPAYQTDGAAAMDLHAFLEADFTLMPMQRHAFPTGLCMQIPVGFMGLVFARSGLATLHGITMANGVGVIDSDYRGEVLVSLINTSGTPFTVRDGDRIAQFLLSPAPRFCFEEAEALDSTGRGDGGFGSTGIAQTT